MSVLKLSFNSSYIITLFLFVTLFSCQSGSNNQVPDTPLKPWNYGEPDRPIKEALTSEYYNSRPPRIVANLNRDWTFNYHPSSKEQTEIAEPTYNDLSWDAVAIPHTWQTYETTGDIHPYNKSASERDDPYWWRGWGYYRKRFSIKDQHKNKKVFLEFDGVQKYAKVYVNGNFIGDHKGGFNSFSFDVTDHVDWEGENILVVMVNNYRRDEYSIPPMTAGNWNVYGGIYRDVRLVVKNRLFIPYQGSYKHEGGTFITTPSVSNASADVAVATFVRNEYPESKTCKLVTEILDPDGKVVSTLESSEEVPVNETIRIDQGESIDQPQLWSPASPVLYKVVSRVYWNDELQDTYENPLGFRWFEWDYDNNNLHVNGEKINIRGFNRHQEYPWVGDAIPDWITEKDMYDIKYGLGANFMRAAHYPNDPLLYDMADQLGIIMVEEVPNIKSIDFNEQVQEQNVREMIRRDRNHPSIFFWSMGNETNDGADSKWAVQEDTTRLIHSRKSEDVGDFIDHDHENLDMENLLRVTIHGWFTQDDIETDVDGNPKNGQHASTEAWQHQMAMVRGGSVRGLLDHNCMAWLYEDHGADREYKNSPVLHINPKGWVDNYRIPKLVYFLTQANHFEDKPVLFVHPYYWRKKYLGTAQDIIIDSNCDEVELYVNDVSKGVFKPAKKEFNTVTAKDITIEEGTLKAVGKKGGKEYTQVVQMPGEPVRLAMESTHQEILADRSGLAVVTVYALDENGNLVFDAQNELNWSVEGAGTLSGYNTYKTDIGKFEALEGTGYIVGPVSNIVRSTNEPGKIKVSVSSPGLEGASITISTIAPEEVESAVVQPKLSDQGRKAVERIEGFVEQIEYKEVISRITENQQFEGRSKAEYRNALDDFIRNNNPEIRDFPGAYNMLLDQLAANVSRLNGDLIADDFNFTIEEFNNYMMIHRAIDLSNLHVEYGDMLKQYYAEQILCKNKQLNIDQEVTLIQNIPSDHVPLYIRKPNANHPEGDVHDNYVQKIFEVWSEDVETGLMTAFPSYRELSAEQLKQVYTYMARITPYVEYNADSGKFTFEERTYLIVPDPNAQEFIEALKNMPVDF